MTWVRKAPTVALHACAPPMREVIYQYPSMSLRPDGAATEYRENVPGGFLGDLWRCDECNRLWRIGCACQLCDRNGVYLHGGHCIAGYRWRPARWWQRIAHHRTKEAE